MKVDVYTIDGKKSIAKADLNPKVFEIKPSDNLIYQVVTSSLSNKRRVLASMKIRSEVRGGGKKPWRQKGTGRARAGSNRSPIWRGGGITFGPRLNRNFKKGISKKMNQKAMIDALSLKSSAIIVLEKLVLEKPNTKKMAEILSKLPVEGKIVLLYPGKDLNIKKSASNLAGVKPVSLNNLNVLDILNCDSIVISKDGLKVLEENYAK